MYDVLFGGLVLGCIEANLTHFAEFFVYKSHTPLHRFETQNFQMFPILLQDVCEFPEFCNFNCCCNLTKNGYSPVKFYGSYRNYRESKTTSTARYILQTFPADLQKKIQMLRIQMCQCMMYAATSTASSLSLGDLRHAHVLVKGDRRGQGDGLDRLAGRVGERGEVLGPQLEDSIPCLTPILEQISQMIPNL